MKVLSISVMAHTSREEFFPYLKERLGDVPFAIDGGWGITENCKKAWRLRDPKADWHVVIQDDAIVCDNFKEKALAVIEEAEKRGDAAVSFFFGKRKMLAKVSKKALEDGYYEGNWLHWGLAICLRQDVIEPMLKYFDTQNIKQDDTRISLFLKKVGHRTYYPMPSLIEHRAGKSLVGDGASRQAYAFIDTKI